VRGKKEIGRRIVKMLERDEGESESEARGRGKSKETIIMTKERYRVFSTI